MKYLKKYNLFKEGYDINDTDKPDVKLAKEESNKLEKNLKDFPSIKSDIDKAFNDTKDDKDNSNLNGKIENIEKKYPNNPFLKKWVEICKLNREVSDIQNTNTKDKLKLDDFQEELKLSTDSETKLLVNTKIQDIKNRMAKKSQQIVDKLKKIEELKVNNKKDMDDIRNKMYQNIKDIQKEIS